LDHEIRKGREPQSAKGTPFALPAFGRFVIFVSS
jgi:hypothetical protein